MASQQLLDILQVAKRERFMGKRRVRRELEQQYCKPCATCLRDPKVTGCYEVCLCGRIDTRDIPVGEGTTKRSGKCSFWEIIHKATAWQQYIRG